MRKAGGLSNLVNMTLSILHKKLERKVEKLRYMRLEVM